MKITASFLFFSGFLPFLAAQQIIRDYPGDQAQDSFGGITHVVGDFDLDGIPDHAVAGRYSDWNAQDGGVLKVYSGATGAILLIVAGDHDGDWLGHTFDGIGDLTGDGIPEIAVGIPLDDTGGQDAGAVRVVNGADGSTLYEWYGSVDFDQFGWHVSSVGDIDADGFEDLAACAPYGFDPAMGFVGYVRLYSGATGQLIDTLVPPEPTTDFGRWVADLEDIDGDGYDDFALGSPGGIQLNGVHWSGFAALYSGRTRTIIRTYTSALSGQFGFTVGRSLDVDGDGLADLVVGDPSARLVWLFSSSTGANLLTVAEGNAATSSLFGSRACEADGDFNGDGFPDLIVGSYRDDRNGAMAGRLRVYSTFDGALLADFLGDEGSDWLGFSGCYAGDLDGDGCDEILVGCNQWFKTGYSGFARVYRGDPAPMEITDPVPAVAGTINMVAVKNATPGGLVSLFAGGRAGATRLTAASGASFVINIANAFQPPWVVSDSRGTAVFRADAPASLSGRLMRFQAVDWLTGRFTPLVRVRFR